MPTVNSTDQKFIGLIAVFPDSTFSALTVSGDYTIDWGDGTTENIAATVQANHLYDYTVAALSGTNAPVTLTDSGDLVARTAHGYSAGMTVSFYNIVNTTGLTEGQTYYVINPTTNTFQVSATVGGSAVVLTSDGTATLLPYKQALVVVTPQSGQTLTALNLNVRNSTSGLQKYEAGWLDVTVGSPNFSTPGLVIAATSLTTNVYMNMAERVTVTNFGDTTDLSYRFYGMRELKSVSAASTAAVTSMDSMFSGCSGLQTVPPLNTAAVTNMSSMFRNCYSLQTVPLLNTAAVTSMSSMFFSCYCLQTVPPLNTAAVTSMDSMFQNCYSLQTVPLLNTAAVTSMFSMFSGCSGLQTVPPLNTAAVTSMNSMFSGCSGLQTAPLLNTAAVTNMSSMFRNCYSLQTVPPLNTAAVTSMDSMFQNCYSLQTVPLLNTAAVTSMSSMFSGCYQISRIKASQFKYTFSVASCKLSDAALNEIYTNLPTVTGQTITVTGNYGTATDNPTIATAKGWTVSG